MKTKKTPICSRDIPYWRDCTTIILIAVITAEYSGYVTLFIVYRLLFAIIYTVIEIRTHGLPFGLSKLPYILLGIIDNIFCFSVLHVYKLQEKIHYGGGILCKLLHFFMRKMGICYSFGIAMIQF